MNIFSTSAPLGWDFYERPAVSANVPLLAGTTRTETTALLGAVEVTVMVWAALATVKDCWTWVAANQLALPAWLKSRTQVPTVWNETTPPEIEHTADEVASTVMATLSDEVAVAVGV